MSETELLRQSVASSLPTVPTSQITLQIGERRFITTLETLTRESGFFSALLSGRWNNAQADGSYFIDADPELFEHILRYLRRGVLPIFYDKAKGHDYARYLALAEEANYFQIARLEKWIKDKTYLQVVKISHSAKELESADAIDETIATDVEVEYHPTLKTEKVYVCPRGISVHHGNPSACGRLCQNARGDKEDEYVDKDVLITLVIRKRIFFDQRICVEER